MKCLRLTVFSAVVAIVAIATPLSAQSRNPQAEQHFKTAEQFLLQSSLSPARISLLQALKSYQAASDPVGQRRTLIRLAFVDYRQGQYSSALSHLQQAQAFPGNVDRGAINSLRGLIQLELGEYQRALQNLVTAEGAQKPDLVAEIRNQIGLGEAYHALGIYRKALEKLHLARQSGSDRINLGRANHAIAEVYVSLGQYDQAKEYYQQALNIRRGIGDQLGWARSLHKMGQVSQILKQPTEAQQYYDQALRIMNGLGDHPGRSSVLNSLAQLAAEQGKLKVAIEYYQDALAITRLSNGVGRVAILNSMGQFYNQQKQFEKAIESFEEALRWARKNGDRLGEVAALSGLGEARLRSGQTQQATETLKSAVEQFEQLRPGLRDQDKVSLFDTQAHVYRLLQEALVRQNQSIEALRVAEQGRARAFVELLSQRLTGINAPTVQSPSIAQIQATAKQQKATIVTYSVIYGADQQESALYTWVIKPSGEVHFRQVDLAQLQKLLNVSLDNIARESRSAAATGEDAPNFTNLVVAMRGKVSDRAANSAPTLASTQNAYRVLIEPIENLLPTDPQARVIFVPQDALFVVPFAALQDSKGKYLIEKHTIQVSPSIQTLALTQSGTRSQSKKALIVGNPAPMPEQLPPLPGSEKEANTIAQLFQTDALIGSEATKSRVLEKIQQASIIHFATHGLLDDQQALQSSLALAGQNGLLTAEEILDLRLTADLAVLSACNTGRGRITGDGVIGLSRSLMSAGVSSVVVSLWLVPDDSTAQLMSHFYRYLKQDVDRAQALRKAMLDTMKQYPNPRDWAGFLLIGQAI